MNGHALQAASDDRHFSRSRRTIRRETAATPWRRPCVGAFLPSRVAAVEIGICGWKRMPVNPVNLPSATLGLCAIQGILRSASKRASCTVRLYSHEGISSESIIRPFLSELAIASLSN
jgi:hypothetical protein